MEILDPDWVDVFPIEHGDVQACYVSLPARIFAPKLLIN